MAKLALAAGAAIGAACAYLLDPDRGRSRRARLYDQAAAVARKATRRSKSWAEYQKGAARGAAHRLSKWFKEEEMFDDDKLLQKIRSEALGPSAPSREDVSIDVDNGVVTLDGRVSSSGDHEQLLELIAQVEGVAAIRDGVEVGR